LRRFPILVKTQPLLYCTNASHASQNKQLRLVDAKTERKLWKAVCGYFLQAAQLPAKERKENASAVSCVWNGGNERLPRMAKIYECEHCHQRFTQTNSLQRHIQTCSQGKTVIVCPGEKVEKPQTAYGMAFYPKRSSSKPSLLWLEREAKRRKIHIHHAMCGHGGERWVEGAPVDGYNHATKTVFQYHGCHWHGCRKCFPQDRNKIIDHGDQTRERRLKATMKRTAFLRKNKG